MPVKIRRKKSDENGSARFKKKIENVKSEKEIGLLLEVGL